ncbi:MAG: hypothetical protein GX279_11880 [Clostridiaceae bacterium]|nr:hypothetical protein [Clostridiaceae bacterium]
MSTNILSRRTELALMLLRDLKANYHKIDTAAANAASGSISCYDQAVEEMKDELQRILDEYNKNIEMIREINEKITSSVNSWHNFLKDNKSASMLTFPFTFHIRRKKLNKEIESMNKQISEISISNRFLKEKLTAARLKLEVRAVSLAHGEENYKEYDKLLQTKKALEGELKYLLPTIPGMCPADITSHGIDTTIAAIKRGHSSSIKEYLL